MPFQNQRAPSDPVTYGGVSIDPATGSVTAATGDFGSLSVDGDDVLDLIARGRLQAEGTMSLYRMVGTSPDLTQQHQQLFSITRTFSDSRDYLMVTPPLRINFKDSRTYTNFADRYVELQVTATSSNSPLANWTRVTYGYSVAGGWRSHLIPSSTFEIVKNHLEGNPKITFKATLRVSIAGEEWSVTSNNPASFVLLDMGTIEQRTYNQLDLASLTNTGTAPVPDPPDEPTTRQYTGTFYATGYANYSVDSGQSQSWPNLLRQSTAGTTRAGFATFQGNDQYGRSLNNLQSSNATIQKVVVYIGDKWKNETVKWYYSGGGIGRLYQHDAASFGGSIPGRVFIGEITNWKNGQVRSMDITSHVANRIKAGTFEGIALSGQGVSGQYTYHGQFPSRPRLVITYTITE